MSLQTSQSAPSNAATKLSVAVPFVAPQLNVSNHSLQAAFTSSEAASEAATDYTFAFNPFLNAF